MKKVFAILSLLSIVTAVNAASLLVDDFESYIDDYAMNEVWSYSKAGGPDGLFPYISDFSTPDGNQCLELDVDMPNKWWYNKYTRDIPEAPLDLSLYKAVKFWYRGDDQIPVGSLSVGVFLVDSTGRVIRYLLPNDVISNPEWQEMSLAFSAFEEDQWDAGYGTSEPDANREDIVQFGVLVSGNEDAITGICYMDSFIFISELGSSNVSGTVTQAGAPLANTTVYAIGADVKETTQTDANGAYSFTGLTQGKRYRIVAVQDGLDFVPGLHSFVMLDDEYTDVNFDGAPSVFNDIDVVSVADQFDAAGLSSSIAYRCVAQWNSPGNDRPVIDVTQEKSYLVGFPGNETLEAILPAIGPNTQSGATSPNFAVEVGTTYSWDMIAIGQNTSRNYFVEADVYCELRNDVSSGFERVSVGARANSFNPARPVLDAGEDTVEYFSTGGYALSFETDTWQIAARKYAPSNTTSRTLGRLEGHATEYATMDVPDSGWYRFRIECKDNVIRFLVNGQLLDEVTDDTYEFGPACLHYRECYPDFSETLSAIHHARFDNLKVGPTGTGIEDWMLN